MATSVLDTLITRFLYSVDASQLDRAASTLGRAKDKADKFGNSLMAAGAVLTGALAGVGAKVLQFEENLNAVQAAGVFTREEMALLREEAQRMGATTAFSASQAAEAELKLAQAGNSSAQIIQLLPQVLDLAAAGSLSMAEAADIASSSLKGFGKDVDELGRISDVLAVSASSANTDVSRMGFAFGKAAPAARAVGVEVEATAAMLAVLQDNGQGAEVAGTGLKTMLFKLVSPTKDATKALKQMGISQKDLQGYMAKGDVVGLFKAMKRGGLDAAKAASIFGLEQGALGLILANSSDKVEELLLKLLKAEGASKRMAQTKMQGLPGAFKTTTSVMEGFIFKIGEAGLTGQIEGLLHFLGNLFDMLSSLPDPILQIIGWVLLAGPALLTLGVAFKTAAFAAGGLQAVLAMLSSTGLASIIREFILVARATNIWTAAQWLLNGALTANPIGVIVMGLAALVGAIIRVIAIWDKLKKAWAEGGLWGAIKRFFNFFGDDEEEQADSGNTGQPSNAQKALAQAGALVGGKAPMPTAPVGGTSTMSTTKSTVVHQDNSVSVGEVKVDARGGDAKQIVHGISDELAAQSTRVIQGTDSKVAE